MLYINTRIQIDESELEESFVRASGPGGQNVNKVASAVQLRFNLAGFAALDDDVKLRLARLAGRRLSADGVILIEARRYRDQERNRADARERLAALIRRALQAPTLRKPTRPTHASKVRRVQTKRQRSGIKRQRQKPQDED